jgi:hypothetical protein
MDALKWAFGHVGGSRTRKGSDTRVAPFQAYLCILGRLVPCRLRSRRLLGFEVSINCRISVSEVHDDQVVVHEPRGGRRSEPGRLRPPRVTGAPTQHLTATAESVETEDNWEGPSTSQAHPSQSVRLNALQSKRVRKIADDVGGRMSDPADEQEQGQRDE